MLTELPYFCLSMKAAKKYDFQVQLCLHCASFPSGSCSCRKVYPNDWNTFRMLTDASSCVTFMAHIRGLQKDTCDTCSVPWCCTLSDLDCIHFTSCLILVLLPSVLSPVGKMHALFAVQMGSGECLKTHLHGLVKDHNPVHYNVM